MAKKTDKDFDILMNTLSSKKFADGGEITTSGKVRDFLHKTVGVPMAINQLGYDISGGQSPITENSLTDDELNAVRQVSRKVLKGNRKSITYGDWNRAGAKDTDNLEQMKQAASDPITNLKFTLGRAAININNGDTTVVDRYNFNDRVPKADATLSNYLKAAKTASMSDPYFQLRILGSYFGSDEQHGSPINIKINQKANGGQLNINDMDNEYSKGGKNWIQKAVNPAHKGFCSPVTKATCTPRRKAFAMTMKKHHGFHEDGGPLELPQLMQSPEDQLYAGGNMYFLGGTKPPEAGALANIGPGEAKGINDSVWGTVDSLENIWTGGKPLETGWKSGALSGMKAGKDLGGVGMLAGALVGGFAGKKQKEEEDWTNVSNDIKQRNFMLGIKAKGGIIFPLGVNQTQVTNYENGGRLTEFNTGGSHEQNANGGILQGADENGVPNKVEQGETKWNDYIFSDRLTVDDNLIQQHNLPEKYRGKTFAEASKTMNKSLKERPNDPIARNTMATNMEALQAANDQEIARTNEIEQQKQMANGGNLFKKGGSTLEEQLYANANPYYNARSFVNQEDKIQPKPQEVGGKFIENPYQMFGQDVPNQSLTGQDIPTPGSKNNFKIPSFLKDSNNLRYAPVAFNAIAGLTSKVPIPKTYSPTLVKSQGALQAPRVDEQTMRNAIDAGYQNQIRGLADVSGGSGATVRAGLLGAGSNYMSALGQGFLQANQANTQSKMAADQYNLQSGNTNALQNAQMLSQADQYNTQTRNARDLANYENKMSYLGQGAQDLGEIGKEERFAKIMPKVYGYDQYGNYTLLQGEPQSNSMPKLPVIKKCGGKLKLRMKK